MLGWEIPIARNLAGMWLEMEPVYGYGTGSFESQVARLNAQFPDRVDMAWARQGMSGLHADLITFYVELPLVLRIPGF